MSRRPAAFTRSDIKRAIDAVCSAGLGVSRVEIDPAGRIVVATNAGANEGLKPLERDDWSDVNWAPRKAKA